MKIFELEPLTEKQEEVYNFLKSEIREKGFPPSIREIGKAVSLRSTSSVHAHLSNLEAKGYIAREAGKKRNIEILEKNFYNFDSRTIPVPIIGKVTAGTPILAEENIEDEFLIPLELVTGKEVYLLRVFGDSMKDKGILDGDLVLVNKQNTANDADIVVARIDNEVTVKSFFKEKNAVRLQPANDDFEPIYSQDVEVVGLIIGLFRMY